ncbi:MAG: aldehyde dehydrogenase, partial [Nocardioidaceae bacterium]|nr:aldehyde dehydrogenase [Nocardioidaceae bacterium]
TTAGTGKRLTLELGGKAANVVFDDAPLDQAVEGIVNGIYFNQGHVCCAGSRLLVQESIAEELVSALKRRLATLRLGDPLDKNTDIGAINSAEQLGRIRELADSADAEGARRWSPQCPLPERGYWFPPTLFTDVSAANRIAREEIFGPVLSVLTFRTPAEAVAKANNTPYGLSAGIWTDKGSRILWMAEQLAKIRELSDIGEAEGAQRWSPPCELPDRGFWFAPTIFTGVSQSDRIAREEIFGPVLSVLTFRTPDEAVAKANNTPYGLSAGVWTDKGSRILWMADRLRAGVVWANTFNRFDPTSPFGGYKESGYGREGGRHGLEAYLAR